MRIGIIGAGHIGSTLAGHLAGIGHEVALANSRDPATLKDVVADIEGPVSAVDAAEAARFGQVVVVSIPFGHVYELPTAELRDKLVVDTCNYHPERDGYDAELDSDTTTSSQKLRDLTDANLVKAFNAIFWETLRDGARPKGSPERIAIPLSGDDEEAKAVVSGLIRDVGFDPVDAGRLGGGGSRHQPGTPVYASELSARDMDAWLHMR